MHESVFFNFGLVSASEPNLPALSASGLFGKGIFTTLAVYEGQPFLWEKHWKRLEKDSNDIGFALAEFSKTKVRDALASLVAVNSVQNGRVRVTFFDESPSELWPYSSDPRTSLLITTGDFHAPAKDLSLTLSPHRVNSTSPLAGIKSCNYLEKILAKEEAKRRGFDESIQLNERGEVTSACMANVFWLKGGKLFTPSLKTGCLAGTTREFVLENIDCNEVEVGIEEVRSADEIFLTSAGLGVVQAAKIEERILKHYRHPIMELLPLRPE